MAVGSRSFVEGRVEAGLLLTGAAGGAAGRGLKEAVFPAFGTGSFRLSLSLGGAGTDSSAGIGAGAGIGTRLGPEKVDWDPEAVATEAAEFSWKRWAPADDAAPAPVARDMVLL